MEEKDRDEAWEYCIHLLAGLLAAVVAWCGPQCLSRGSDGRIVFLVEKHAPKQRANGIPGN